MSEPSTVGWLPRDAEELFGAGASAAEAYGLLTVDVPAERWIPALTAARDELGCTYFDWLSAVDEPDTGFQVCAHLVALPGGDAGVRRLVVRTTVPHDAPELPTATGVYAGAAWHERETHEMFGVAFADHPYLEHLLLPESFEGNPLRKDFVLAARVAKAWPGAKEPGESGHGGPKRRQMLPPGVPDPNEWGPLKGQLPPAPSRPARSRAAGATGDRPARPRRDRTAAAGSASQQAAPAGPAAPAAPAQSDAPWRKPRTEAAEAETGGADAPEPSESPESAELSESPESAEPSESSESPQKSEPPEQGGEG